jgi:hypothetical protein
MKEKERKGRKEKKGQKRKKGRKEEQKSRQCTNLKIRRPKQ